MSDEDPGDFEEDPDYEDPGGFEYVYKHVMSDEERDQWDWDQEEARLAAEAASAARMADLERRWAELGCDMFGSPLGPPGAPQAEAADDLDLEAE